MKLHIFNFLFIQSFYIFIQAYEKESVAVVINKGSLELAYPQWTIYDDKDDYYFQYSLPVSPWDEMYHFCPAPVASHTDSLKYMEANQKYAYITFICREDPQPLIAKVTNTEKFKTKWDNNIEWYMSGYKIDLSELDKHLEIPKEIYKSDFQYESINDDEALLPTLSAFYNKRIKQMIAVQYELISAHWYLTEHPTITPVLYLSTESGPDLSNFSTFFEDIYLSVPVHRTTAEYLSNEDRSDSPDELQFELSLKSEEKTDDTSPSNLRVIALAPPSHFVSRIRLRTAAVKINVTSMWNKLTPFYDKINKYLENVAEKIGNLKITSGVTGIGSTRRQRNKRAYKNITNDQKTIVHDFIWKVVEFEHKGQIYGIILVLVNSLSEQQEKICEKDVCQKLNWLIQPEDNEILIKNRRPVYCCNVTTESIENLKVDFLELQERLEFDLKSWNFTPILENNEERLNLETTI